MKKDIFLAMLRIFVIFMAISAHGQQGFDQAYTDSPSAMVPYISEGQYYPTSRSKIISNHPLFWLILGSIIDIMSINARKLSHRFFQLVLAPSYSCSCHVQCANI